MGSDPRSQSVVEYGNFNLASAKLVAQTSLRSISRTTPMNVGYDIVLPADVPHVAHRCDELPFELDHTNQ